MLRPNAIVNTLADTYRIWEPLANLTTRDFRWMAHDENGFRVVTAREEDEDPRLKQLMEEADAGLDVSFPTIARLEVLIIFDFKRAVMAYRSMSVNWRSALAQRLEEQGVLKEPFLYIVEPSSWVETFRAERHSWFTDEYRQAPEWHARPKVHYLISAHPYWIEVVANEAPVVEVRNRLWTDQVSDRRN